MKAKHTPGPWAANPIVTQVDAMSDMLPICQLLWPTDQRSEEETEANARLIAAAPDLLHALQMVRDADNDAGHDGLPRIPAAARATIDAALASAGAA